MVKHNGIKILLILAIGIFQNGNAQTGMSRFFGASETEIYGANATHEEGHSRPSQIILDKKHSNEKTQNSSKNIPMNNEIRYRDQYHIKHPSSNKSWKKLYNRNKQLKKFMKNYEKPQ
jgi:hypothetical protein